MAASMNGSLFKSSGRDCVYLLHCVDSEGHAHLRLHVRSLDVITVPSGGADGLLGCRVLACAHH